MIAICFDCETTGLILNPARKLDMQPEIISLAAQEFDTITGTKLKSYYGEFKPNKSISEEITKITGFTNDQLNTRSPIKESLNEIISFLEKTQLIIGQNINFDMSMLELECQRYNKMIKWPRTLDLVENTIHLKGYRLSLTNLHIELFGKEFDDAHQAYADVEATYRCCIELFRKGLL
jgi:DNA polymerase III epsilon subunit-like protein